jgi:purine-binding chemotaxis protein CheW
MNPALSDCAEPAADGRPESARRDVLVFRSGGQRYAVPLGEVLEIVPMARLAHSPALPALVDGFLNLGGRAVAVVRLSRLLGLPELPPGLHTPLLVLRHAEPPLALLVEGVEHISRLTGDVLPVRADDSFNGAVTGVTTLGGQTVLLLSPDLLLLAKEQQCLAEFQDREQSRLRALGELHP